MMHSRCLGIAFKDAVASDIIGECSSMAMALMQEPSFCSQVSVTMLYDQEQYYAVQCTAVIHGADAGAEDEEAMAEAGALSLLGMPWGFTFREALNPGPQDGPEQPQLLT